MRFSEDDLRAAAVAGVLDGSRLDELLKYLRARVGMSPDASRVAPPPQFDFAHLLWYAGALIVIGAMGLFSTLAFAQMGGAALTMTAVIYAVVFVVAGHHLWYRKNLRVPGGLLIAIAVSMAPLAVYGLQNHFGWWGEFGRPGNYKDFYIWIKGSWVLMEVAAIVAAAIALRIYPFPFIVMIIAFALWFLSMDIVPWIVGKESFDWEQRRQISMWFGLGVLVVAWIVDQRRTGGDFAFWLHLFGMITFWGAITMKSSDSQLAKALYCLLNVGLMVLSVVLMRRVYAVFGALGVSAYLGNLAHTVFRDSLLFPFALSLIGVAVIALGLLYHRHQAAISRWVEERLPAALLALRPAHTR